MMYPFSPWKSTGPLRNSTTKEGLFCAGIPRSAGSLPNGVLPVPRLLRAQGPEARLQDRPASEDLEKWRVSKPWLIPFWLIGEFTTQILGFLFWWLDWDVHWGLHDPEVSF